ncbi:PIN domain-containing protein [Rhodoferax sp. AJA081-3]|uniref:PIN domain-containing protein n=1 Tax=Rhodoferax sp. AJA081-3 TaxID=2752316 RepID=UPI001AE05E3E|nr:PIN domain-containing protein [Rhodoferax sp. AJA081-3]QTN26945.1 PIN domain-containing protein [Rhodoferax sp. AJA081-3]
MAVSGRYTAILDACVLYPRLQRDVLLSLAHADLYTARWTVEIEREWTKALLKNKPGTEASIAHAVEHMRAAIPDCLVVEYEAFIPSIELPDPNDRHVLAAAIRGNADAIVTSNTKDFPLSVLTRFDIELQTPDQFVRNQIMLNPPKALAAIKKMRVRWNRPEITAAQMVDLFERRELPQTAAHLKDVIDLI